MKKFKETLVEEIQVDELDLEYPFYGPDVDENDDEEPNDIDISKMPDIYSEVVSMDIQRALDVLMKLQQKGANRVYFYADTDHQGYIFTGVKLTELKNK